MVPVISLNLNKYIHQHMNSETRKKRIEELTSLEQQLWSEVCRIEEMRKQALAAWAPAHRELDELRKFEEVKAQIEREADAK